MSRKDIIPMERWPLLLPMEIAEHESSTTTPLHTLEEIAGHFDITVEDIEKFSVQPSFKEEVRACVAELKDKNSIIRRKAAAQLELYMDTLIPGWMVDPDFSQAEKVKLLKQLTEWAETGGSIADKAKAKLEALPNEKNTNLNIFITAPDGKSTPVGVTIEQEPEKIEDEKSDE